MKHLPSLDASASTLLLALNLPCFVAVANTPDEILNSSLIFLVERPESYSFCIASQSNCCHKAFVLLLEFLFFCAGQDELPCEQHQLPEDLKYFIASLPHPNEHNIGFSHNVTYVFMRIHQDAALNHSAILPWVQCYCRSIPAVFILT